MTKKNRDRGIDFLKFLAMISVTWSHCDVVLPDSIHTIAAGGALGDALFFFCSGYTLSLGRFDGLINWYKRRVNRIYPTVLMWAFISSMFFGLEWNAKTIIINWDYWFLPCIMFYYFVFYFVHKFMWNNLKILSAVLFVLITLISPFLFDTSSLTLYYNLPYMFAGYFFFMLQGAILARIDKSSIQSKIGSFSLFILSFFFIVLYYLVAYIFKNNPSICIVQTITLLPLLTSVYFLYRFSGGLFMERLLAMRYLGRIITVLSSLTLEVYIVQSYVINDVELLYTFPLNIAIIFILIIALAYLLKICRNIFVIIFSDTPFGWKKLVSV